MNSIDVIVSGHLCLDLFPAMSAIPPAALAQAGRLIEVGSMRIATGGAVSNAGLALHRLGINVRLMATVGGDLIGQMIIAALRERDQTLTELISVQRDAPGSYSVVLSPSGADRTFLHCTGPNDRFDASSVDLSMVRQARAFYLGYPPLLPALTANDGEPLCALYRQVREAGALTALDMTLPDPNGPTGKINWRRVLERTLPYVDVFLPSLEEILFMMRREDFDQWGKDAFHHVTRSYLEALALELINMGANIVGFKLGEYGMVLYTGKADLPDGWRRVGAYSPAFQVEVAGTTGAGDAAYAGFLAAWLKGLPPQDCLRWACAVGACCCEAPDATSGIRTWADTHRRLDSGWKYRPERLAGW
jgi:sugar/nucleoside kinase (ribokinase family)